MSIKARFLALLLPAIIFFPGHVFAGDAAPLTVTTPVSSSPAGTIKIDDKKLIADARQTTAKAGQSVDADSLQTGDAKVKPVSANPATEEKTAPAPSTAQAKPAATVAPDAAHEASKQVGTAAGVDSRPCFRRLCGHRPGGPIQFCQRRYRNGRIIAGRPGRRRLCPAGNVCHSRARQLESGGRGRPAGPCGKGRAVFFDNRKKAFPAMAFPFGQVHDAYEEHPA